LAKRFRKFNLPEPLRIGNLLIVAVLFLVGWGVFNLLNTFVETSPYFKINKVEIVLIGRMPLTDKVVKDLWSMHKGRNIFDVDLRATRDYCLANYPEVRQLVINRVFPDKLVLKVRPRRPVGQIGLSSGFCMVDSEGVILPNISGVVQEGLPIIAGLDSRSVMSYIGRKYDYPAMKKALTLIEVISQMKFYQEHEIHMIDVSDSKNISLRIAGGIEIKFGDEDFRTKISMLNRTLSSGRLDKNQIKYIDLRFGNVIIGPK